MEIKHIDLPILIHAYVPRIVKVGPIFEPDPTPWKINQQHNRQGL